jgi:hypothetical protein
MVSSSRELAKGVANNSGQMVERVIRHPFLNWLCGNTNVRQDVFLLQEQSAKIEGLSETLSDYRLFFADNSW